MVRSGTLYHQTRMDFTAARLALTFQHKVSPKSVVTLERDVSPTTTTTAAGAVRAGGCDSCEAVRQSTGDQRTAWQ